MSHILPMSRRTSAVLNHLLLPLCLGIAASAFAVQPADITLKAAPNQTTTFPTDVFAQSSAAKVSSTNSDTDIGLTTPYSSMNGTVTVCDQSVSYTPAFGFTGTDSFSVTITNSDGSVSPAIA